LLLILAIAAGLAAAVPAVANPVIGGALFTHVRPYDPSAEPIQFCSELVTHTEASGWVDFEIYAYQTITEPPYGVNECYFQLTWPAAWFYDEGWYPIPHGGAGTVQVAGNQAWVALTFPGCPTTAGDFFLLLRLSFWVDGYGELAPVDYLDGISICSPYNTGADYLPAYGAEAGVACDYGYADCAETTACQPEAMNPLIELQVNHGQTAVRTLVFRVPGSTCTPSFAATEPWMSLVVGPPDDDDCYQVTLTVATSELGLGYHEGYVSATDHGAACTLVALTVLDLTGVESASWGRIKSFY
jgi:hypothetical protein